MKLAFEDVDGDAPGPELEAAVGLAALGQLGGEVGILDHLRACRRRVTTTPSFSSGASFSITLNDISASAWRWRPRKAGSAISTSGLSTWK